MAFTGGYTFKFTNYIKKAFCVALRESFKDPQIPERYRYNENALLSKLQVYTSFPRREFKPPTIVVDANVADASISSLGDEILEEVKSGGITEGITLNGKLNVDMIVRIFAPDTSDREMLTDFVALILRYLFRSKFAAYGIGYTKIRIGGETETTFNNAPLFSNTVTVPCYTEMQINVPVELVNNIQRIDLLKQIELMGSFDKTLKRDKGVAYDILADEALTVEVLHLLDQDNTSYVEGTDFTITIVSNKTRINWIGSTPADLTLYTISYNVL